MYPLRGGAPAPRCPIGPGVYRFLRRNGDVLYVGKATSLKKRVAGHFKSTRAGHRTRPRAADPGARHGPIETPSLVEAALLESDEIKRLDPPYNVQLRAGERAAWFASRDLRRAAPAPDDAHRIGPLPSERALEPLAALIALADGAVPTRALCAAALAVPPVFAPERALFDEGFAIFRAEHLAGRGDDRRPDLRLSRWPRRRARCGCCAAASTPQPEDASDATRTSGTWRACGDGWSGAWCRPACWCGASRFLRLLAHAIVAFRERQASTARVLVIAAGAIQRAPRSGDRR